MPLNGIKTIVESLNDSSVDKTLKIVEITTPVIVKLPKPQTIAELINNITDSDGNIRIKKI